MERLLFLEEKRSEIAKERGLRWEHGRLAAKPLFEALRNVGIEPLECTFRNLFENPNIPEIIRHVRQGGMIIALGRKVDDELKKQGIPHIYMVHPAARGRIRRREKYKAHVKHVCTTAGLIRKSD